MVYFAPHVEYPLSILGRKWKCNLFSAKLDKWLVVRRWRTSGGTYFVAELSMAGAGGTVGDVIPRASSLIEGTAAGNYTPPPWPDTGILGEPFGVNGGGVIHDDALRPYGLLYIATREQNYDMDQIQYRPLAAKSGRGRHVQAFVKLLHASTPAPALYLIFLRVANSLLIEWTCPASIDEGVGGSLDATAPATPALTHEGVEGSLDATARATVALPVEGVEGSLAATARAPPALTCEVGLGQLTACATNKEHVLESALIAARNKMSTPKDLRESLASVVRVVETSKSIDIIVQAFLLLELLTVRLPIAVSPRNRYTASHTKTSPSYAASPSPSRRERT